MYKGKFASELSMNEVKEYYDELRQKYPRTEEQWADFNILQEKLIVFAYKVLDGKTNGDVLKKIFPTAKFYCAERLQTAGMPRRNADFDVDWWNAPYRESEE